MKSIFDPSTQHEIIERIQSLSLQNKAQWGKMNVYQMVKHCCNCEDMYLGNIKVKRVWISYLIGSMVLKQVLKDEKPFAKNSPTGKELNAGNESGDLETQKAAWIDRIKQYQNYTVINFVHPFFGPVTREQVGFLDYKHIDHHLRQFGA